MATLACCFTQDIALWFVVALLGASADQLTEAVTRADYAKVHEVTLPGLTPGVTYFYQIVATDLSGNQTTSPVYQIAGELRLYLPAVRKG